MSQEIHTFVADPQGKRDTDVQLLEFLLARGDEAASIDLSAISEVTAARLEILISAIKQRGREGPPLVFVGMSDSFREGLDVLGVPRNLFQQGHFQ